MPDALKDLRSYLFRGLMFEAESEAFRAAGLRVGADLRHAERSLLEETLAPFALDLRNEAMQMMRIYALLYCFENSVRQLIVDRMTERHGADWWEKKVTQKVRDFAKARQATAHKDSWLEGQKANVMGFLEFGHLGDVIANNWSDFEDLIPSQHWLKQRLEELEKARHFIAHNRFLSRSEFERIEMYVSDWNRVVGL
ncbi:MAG: Swt1 family HEPN domain-containing protein [Polyangiaceae bacterium]